nr:unnamed protein product [Spirometra erinaceieuropaei]
MKHPNDATRFPPSTSASLLTSTIDTDRSPEPPVPPPSIASASAAAAAPVPPITDTPRNINLTTFNTSDVVSVSTRPHYDHTSTAHIGLVEW